jgi:histidine triad (HIT) family protein
MQGDHPYDAGNIFARIIRGELPSARVYEDEAMLAFMDAFPQSEGHILVMPKISMVQNILEIDPVTLAQLMAVVWRIARAVKAVLAPDGVIIVQLNGEAAGQTVDHFHVHIIPCWSGQPLDGRPHGKPADFEHLQHVARRLAAALG